MSKIGKKLNYNNVKEYIKSHGYILLDNEYINIHKKMKIKCPEGHIFEMSFNNFKKGQRCSICSLNKQYKYTYSQIKNICKNNNLILLNEKKNLNMRDIIKFKNEKGNIEQVTLYTFERRYINTNKSASKSKYSNKKHSQEYIQSLVEKRGYKLLEPYKNKKTKLKLQCPNGHYHEIRLDSFIKGSGCKQCMIENMTNDVKDVITNLQKKGFHLLSKYKNNQEKIVLQCEKGHIFNATYDNIVNNNSGCPICNESKGEKNIRKILKKYNIKYIPQYKFDNCKFYKCLPFDFYLPDYNCCIEYYGIQHYKIIKHFGGYETFIDRKIRDTVKTKFCVDNNIKIIRISYLEFNDIEKILKNELKIKE